MKHGIRGALIVGLLLVAGLAGPAAAGAGEAAVSLAAVGPAVASPAAARQNWTISFELAFDPKSPYGTLFRPLSDLSYETSLKITREVLGRIIPIALAESGATRRGLLYGPGGWENAVTPSAQLQVTASRKSLETARDIIGYLAQQGSVLSSRPHPQGATPAIQITGRGQELASPKVVTRFWHALRARAPKLDGFSPVRLNGRPGLRIMEAVQQWSDADIAGFNAAVQAASRQRGLQLQMQPFRAEAELAGNDWASAPQGGEYLRRFEQRGQAVLKQRLGRRVRLRVQAWILAAYRRQGYRTDPRSRHQASRHGGVRRGKMKRTV